MTDLGLSRVFCVGDDGGFLIFSYLLSTNSNKKHVGREGMKALESNYVHRIVLSRWTTGKIVFIFQNLGRFRILFYFQPMSRSKAWKGMADLGEEMSCIHKNNCDQRLELTPTENSPKLCRLWSLIDLRIELLKDLKSALSQEPVFEWEAGSDDLQRSLSPWIILWFFDSL